MSSRSSDSVLRRPPRPPAAPFVLAVLLISALVASLATLALMQEKQRYREQASIATQNLSQLFDQHISDIFDKVDVVLQSVVLDYPARFDTARPDRHALNAYLKEREQLLPEVISLRIADRDGLVRYGTGIGGEHLVDIRDRPYFNEAKLQTENHLIVFGPAIGRNSNQWTIKLARRLNTPDGRFAGVVHANIPSSYYERVFSGVALGQHGAASIRTTDLILVHRSPAGRNAVGSREISEQLRQAVLSAPEAGDYIAPTALDGIERSNSYRRLKRYPFYVIVGLATEDYLGGWQQSQNTMIGLSALAIILTLLAALLVYRSSCRQLAEIAERSRIAEELRQHRSHLEEEVAQRTAALQASNDQLADTQFAMDQSGIGIHWINAESGRLLYVNECAASMLGYSPQAMLEMNFGDIAPGFRDRPFGEAAASLLHDQFARFDSTIVHRDGQLLPVQIAIYLLPDRRHGSGRLIAFVTDIAERKHTEASLLHDKNEAELATQAKSTFLAQISHEIRTPMNVILGLAYLVRQDKLTDQQGSQIDKIIGAAQHLLQIINDTLDLAKIDAGKLTLENSRFQLSDVFDPVLSLTADSALAKQLTLDLDYPDAPVWLRGDVMRLRQLLLNYVTNAIKFTEQGSVHISGKLLAETADDALLHIAVHDTGIGISADRLDQLFQPFQQAEASTAREFGGTGLGLAINRRLAELMGGETGGESQPGQGSTFWFKVRLQRCAPPDPATIESSALATLGQHSLRGRHVLLAEDHPLNREVALAMLEDQGLRVDVATNGKEALELVSKADYDLVLIDIQMPIMDGLAATRAIRKLPGRAGLPIIALTANAFLEDRQRCQEAGMDDFIAKPVSPEKLFATLQKWLDGQDEAPPVVPPEQATPAMQAFRKALAGMAGIDLERAYKLVLAGSENYADLLRKYAESSTEDFELLDNHVLTNDLEAAGRVAHSIKGVSLFFGFTHIAGLAAELEQLLHGPGDPARQHALRKRLADEQRVLLQQLFAALAESR